MVSAGKDPNLVASDLVDEAVLGIDAAGPATGEIVLEGLGLAGSGEGIALDLPDELHDPERLR